jgi:hypothetical protein
MDSGEIAAQVKGQVTIMDTEVFGMSKTNKTRD